MPPSSSITHSDPFSLSNCTTYEYIYSTTTPARRLRHASTLRRSSSTSDTSSDDGFSANFSYPTNLSVLPRRNSFHYRRPVSSVNNSSLTYSHLSSSHAHSYGGSHSHPIFTTTVHDANKYHDAYVTRTVHKSVASSSHYNYLAVAIRSAEKTSAVVDAFAKEFRLLSRYGWTLDVIVPSIVTVKKKSADVYSNDEYYTRKVEALKEDYIPGMETVLTNSGWYKDFKSMSTGERALLALPAYSWSWSGGEFMIAGMKARIDNRRKTVTISQVDLFSRSGGVYGSPDLGPRGVRNMFYWLPTNEFSQRFVRAAGAKKSDGRQLYYRPKPYTILE